MLPTSAGSPAKPEGGGQTGRAHGKGGISPAFSLNSDSAAAVLLLIVSDPLRALLADARLPGGRLTSPGGVEAACAEGLVHDIGSLREFLFGRLWTAGAVGAGAAAAVCARSSRAPDSLWRTAEAEIDARTPSPAAREVSRTLGGRMLRAAMDVVMAPLFDAIGTASVSSQQQPHYPVVVGAVAAVAGASPLEAAEAAAYAYVAGPAFAAQRILQLTAAGVVELGMEMAPEVSRLAAEAAATCLRPLSQMPSFSAPALEYLAEAHAARSRRVQPVGSGRPDDGPDDRADPMMAPTTGPTR